MEPSQEKEIKANLQILDDSLLLYNQKIVQIENQEIADFINRYKWRMETTSTGLRFVIIKKGTGLTPNKGATVTISYSVKLLTGDVVFQSDSLHPFTFIAGQRKVTSGLEEGVMLMHQGDRAKFIVPSYLAYGLLGDLEKIPTRAILVYYVELIHVTNPIN
ncbi:MAG: FKBP-type peptidyl-prolyl cis-trans isomerase [Bacteroidetes bacterium]|nr:FKBP-type peptidyl-prolyl cis-trans isomerase [Bacteroidota bacterium]